MFEQKLKRFTPQIGEILQHHISPDSNIAETSEWYYGFVKGVLERNQQRAANRKLGGSTPVLSRNPKRYLEIASYRHIIGYRLGKDYGFESTHFDLCDRDLEIGRETALANGFADTVDRVTGDFHDLPFSDNYFDLSFISAAIHHTRTPERIISEALRVLTQGGLFYCQREPCERLFCFYRFNANRAVQFTPFERRMHEQDLMRIISSPYPGARNAELFGRIENDRIPLEMYYETFAQHGEVDEEVVYHEGLLTRHDKAILEQAALPEDELRTFIRDLLQGEFETLQPTFSRQDELLGYSLPGEADIDDMAARMVAALKARPRNEKSIEWRRAMAKIFGGTLRFVVRRTNAPKTVSTDKFRRSTTQVGLVRHDDAVYKHSGLNFWTRLLPDIQQSDETTMFGSSFPESDWIPFTHPNGMRMMQSKSDRVQLLPPIRDLSLLVMRYRVVVDKSQPFVRLKITYGDEEVEAVTVAINEDRILRLVYSKPSVPVVFEMTGVDGEKINGWSRLRISILQGVPIDLAETVDEDATARTATS